MTAPAKRGRPKGTGHPTGPRSEKVIAAIAEYRTTGASLRALGRKYGISHQAVQQAIARHAPELLKRN